MLLSIIYYFVLTILSLLLADEHDHIIEEDWRSSQTSSFCENIANSRHRYFPTDLPEHHIPWIWDAVYDPRTEILELTTMSRIPCRFDKNQWHELVSLYPRYQHQFGYGQDNNNLVPVDENITREQEYHLIGSTVDCHYYDGDKFVYSTPSLRIRGSKALSSLGTLQIRCPAPSSMQSTWNQVQLSLNPHRSHHIDDVYHNMTALVPVCRISGYDINVKRYNITICTATKRANRSNFVEWIEYHRLIGVNHFYIYNTAIDDSRDDINDVLRDYVDNGIVTIIPWHYHNCVRDMASGRWTPYHKNGEVEWFKAPFAIAQSAALASCYARFKHTSKYMMHIDDDEFIVFSPEKMQKFARSDIMPVSLGEAADIVFDRYPRTAALRFDPVQYLPCHIKAGQEYSINNVFIDDYHSYFFSNPKLLSRTPLPRLGVWDQANKSPSHEGKMIMRTEAVGMFFVHFISLLEYGPWRVPLAEPLPLPIDAATMLHYRFPYQWSKQALEGELPLRKRSLQLQCANSRKQGYTDSRFHARIDSHVAQQLKVNFIERIKKSK